MSGLMTPAMSAFGTGFAIGFSLIMAIGAQNAFVLRQGLMRSHIFAVALFCAGSDALLITAGVGGASLYIAEFADRYSNLLFGFASLWLAVYGALRLRDAIRGDGHIAHHNVAQTGLVPTLAITAMLTFGNPHVYLDTVVLIGAMSLKFEAMNKIYYGLGAAISSFVFFFSLVYGARFLAPYMERPNAWRILDTGIAAIMFSLALSMLRAGGLI
ncbi:MAG: LysE family transporter [Alphaproteobacteria bacterium]